MLTDYRSGRASGRGPPVLFFVLWLLAALAPARAHNPDTSYLLVRFAGSTLEIRFILDIVTLLKVVELDADEDHSVSRQELQAKAPQIHQFLREHVRFEIDGRPSDFGEPRPVTFAWDVEEVLERDYHLILAHFVFIRSLAEMPEQIRLAYDVFGPWGENHVVLARILQGEDRAEEILFHRFQPDYTYETGVEKPALQQMARFCQLGVSHIFIGYDHILFLLALIVVGRFLELVKIVTAFTLAHSLTLALAVLGWVRLPERLVEAGIALTIVYVAAENLWARRTEHRWVLTFCFGLVHGLGFAQVLRELGLPPSGLARSLVAFNVGVELGQLAIVAVAWPLWLWLSRQASGPKVKPAVSILILLFGLAWLVERTFGLSFMPI